MTIPGPGMAPFPTRRVATPNFAGYSLAFSPFFPNKLACASSMNYGLVGNGRLHLLDTASGPGIEQGGVALEKVFDTQDGLYDLAWSEIHENQLVTGSGDGSIKLWDVTLKDFPIRNWHEHGREVFGVDWNNIRKEIFASCSWDATVKIWTPDRPTSLQTLSAHSACIYASVFSPHQPDILATCSADSLLKIWDIRTPQPSAPPPNPQIPQEPTSTPSLTIAAHPTEILSLDWNKYLPNIIYTGSVDRSIRVHDLRMASSTPNPNPSSPLQQNCTTSTLLGHEYAIRRVAWSPHSSNLLASGSYDMTARIWQVDAPNSGRVGGMGSMRYIHDEHKEFVVGLAWSLYEEGVVGTCSWDTWVHLWRAPPGLPPGIRPR